MYIKSSLGLVCKRANKNEIYLSQSDVRIDQRCEFIVVVYILELRSGKQPSACATMAALPYICVNNKGIYVVYSWYSHQDRHRISMA